MMDKENIETMRKLLVQAFPNFNEAKREEMLNDLLNRYPNPIPFCVMNGMNIARIGVRYESSNNSKGSYYYVTEYDNDLLDL